MDRGAEVTAKVAYTDIMTTVRDLPGDVANPTTAKGKFVKTLTDAWDKNYGDMTLREQGGEVLSRAESLVRGVVGVPEEGLPSAKRAKLMALVFAGAYLANLNDANTEKYGTCGTSALCLHWPKWFDSLRSTFGLNTTGNNMDFKLNREVKTNFSDLVMVKQTGILISDVLRFNLVSPCKADLTVKAYNATSNPCKCKKYFGPENISYRLDKVRCYLDTNNDGTNMPINITMASGASSGCGALSCDIGKIPEPAINLTAPALCPKKFEVKADTTYTFYYGLNTKYRNIKIPKGNYSVVTVYETMPEDEGFGPFSDCKFSDKEDPDITLQNCAGNQTHTPTTTSGTPCSPATNDALDTCLKQKYRECYDGRALTDSCPKKDDAFGITELGSIYAPRPAKEANYKLFDVVPTPLNLKANILDSEKLIPVSECEESWGIPLTVWANKPCLIVSVNSTSLESYSKNGFGSNFCIENKVSTASFIQTSCVVGSIAASIAITAFSGGAAAPLLFVVGSGATFCDQIANTAHKWPNSQ